MPNESRVRSSKAPVDPLGAVCEVRRLVGAILDRKDPWDVLEIVVRGAQGLVLDADGAVEAQFLCAPRKPRDPNVIAESVLKEAQARRLRANLKIRLDDLLGMGIARTRSIKRCSPKATARR
jgi:hypothetical protein